MASNFKLTTSYPVGASALTKGSMVDTATGLVVTTSATDIALGAMEADAEANATAGLVCDFGITHTLAHDGNIAKGDLLELAAGGRVDTHSTTSTKPVIGIAREDSAAQDDLIETFLFPPSSAGPAA